MNPDEENSYKISTNYLAGKGYTNNGKKSAYHGSFTVFLYQKLIQYKISKKAYIVFYHFLALILFLISIPYFFKILLFFQVPKNIALLPTTIYAFYPSNIYYIGNFFWYEKIVLPLLIIAFYSLFQVFKENQKNKLFLLLPIIVTLSCLLRAHMIVVYFMVILAFIIYALFSYRTQKLIPQKISVLSLTLLLMIAAHVPILIKNHKLFGEYILSTQTGYELMQGHNDLARGNWNPDCYDKESVYYKYSAKNIKNLSSLNQYEEGIARKEFTINWIKNNPKQELILIFKKTAIFFLPKNFSSAYHLVNTIVHLGFFMGFLFMMTYKRIDSTSILLLSPVFAVYLISLIFFVGLRWRYYAEPFFILFATYHLVEYAYRKKWIKQLFN